MFGQVYVAKCLSRNCKMRQDFRLFGQTSRCFGSTWDKNCTGFYRKKISLFEDKKDKTNKQKKRNETFNQDLDGLQVVKFRIPQTRRLTYIF